MIRFSNDAELWQFLLNGGTVIEKHGHRREIKLVNGMKTYTKTADGVNDFESAKNCLLSFDWWYGKAN